MSDDPLVAALHRIADALEKIAGTGETKHEPRSIAGGGEGLNDMELEQLAQSDKDAV